MTHHLAQINIGRPRYPLDSPGMADFMNALDPINALAEASPGYVWRLVGESGQGATDVANPFGDDVIVNMSVWESVEQLRDYVYASGHLDYLRRRKEWLHHEGIETYMALWWVPAGHIPTLDEAAERLDHLAAHGPTDYAFTFRQPFRAPAAP